MSVAEFVEGYFATVEGQEVWIDPVFSTTTSDSDERNQLMPTPEEIAAEKASAEALAADKHAVEEIAAKEKADKADYAARMRKERDEAQAELRKRQEADEDAKRKQLAQEKEFAKLAEMEREKREEAEKAAEVKVAEYQKRAIRAEVKALAINAGLVDSDVVALIDLSNVRLDDSGDVVGAKEAVEAFKAAKPHLFKSADADKGDKEAKPVRKAPPSGSSGKDAELDPYALPQDKFDQAWERLGRVQAA